MPYVDTYYKTRLCDPGPRPALRESVDVDVCIVGAGLAGLTAALELAQGGRSVCLLEAERVGWGASGRNGGFVSPGYSAGHGTLRRHVSRDHALTLHRLSIEGARAVSEKIQKFALKSAVNPTPGALSASRYEAAAELQSYRDWLAREFDYPVDLWERDRVRASLNSSCYHQAIYQPQAFHFDPLAYARALAIEIERLGGRIFEATAATSIDRDGAAQIVGAARGHVRARDVVIATGGYTGELLPRLRASYLPIATYVMLTEAAPELIATAVRTEAAIGDRRRAGDYYRLVENGARLLWGGKITTRVSEPRSLAVLMRQTMVATYPQLVDLKVDFAWTGLMAYARHLMPQIGALEPGLWYCTAFGGHGMNTTAIGGRVIAEAILGESDRYRLFAPFGLTWNGGFAGRAAVQATYWALQAQDAWRERWAG